MKFLSTLSENITSRLVTILTVAIAWVLFFNVNTYALTYFNHSQHISYVFLPSGIRLIAVLLCGVDGVLGLFVGALFSNFNLHFDTTTILMFSLISSLNPYVSVALTKYFLKLDTLLVGIKPKNLFSLSFFAALCNCITHNIYFWLHHLEKDDFIKSSIKMFIGDFLGALIVLYIIGFGIKGVRMFVGKPQ